MPSRAVVSAVVGALFSTASATTIHVDVTNCPGPGDGSEVNPYCSIQAAIDNATDGDEVVVAAGTYLEPIDFLADDITVRSADGPEVTTIDGQGSAVVVRHGGNLGPGAILEGFTLTGGGFNGPPLAQAAAISVRSGLLTAAAQASSTLRTARSGTMLPGAAAPFMRALPAW